MTEVLYVTAQRLISLYHELEVTSLSGEAEIVDKEAGLMGELGRSERWSWVDKDIKLTYSCRTFF